MTGWRSKSKISIIPCCFYVRTTVYSLTLIQSLRLFVYIVISILLYLTDLLEEARELQKKAEEELSKCKGMLLCRIEYHSVEDMMHIQISDLISNTD